jgi:outer membrane lipoprotein LolB
LTIVAHHASRAVVLVSLILAAACKTVPTDSARSVSPETLRFWQASGRIAVSGQDGGGSGSFVWRQQGEESDVQIRGPLGVGSLHLMLSDDALKVQTGDGQSLTATDAQAELESRLGATIPTHSLRYWFLGLPAPGEHDLQAAVDSTTLQQESWRIDFQRYASTGGVRLPMRWVAVNGPAKVRVIVDKWQLR